MWDTLLVLAKAFLGEITPVSAQKSVLLNAVTVERSGNTECTKREGETVCFFLFTGSFTHSAIPDPALAVLMGATVNTEQAAPGVSMARSTPVFNYLSAVTSPC